MSQRSLSITKRELQMHMPLVALKCRIKESSLSIEELFQCTALEKDKPQFSEKYNKSASCPLLPSTWKIADTPQKKIKGFTNH